MSHATYHSHLWRPERSTLIELLRELYAATPLAVFLRAVRAR